MINSDMRTYDYFIYSNEDAYGQKEISNTVTGTIKMAIYLTSQTVQDNINYKDSQYIGLTLSDIDDSFVIKYGERLLKVLYVNSQGRYTQVFMGEL